MRRVEGKNVAPVNIPTTVDSADFRSAMRQVASPVAIVTARSGDIRNGLAATAVCSVAADPPTVLACVNRNSTVDGIIAESGAFAVNFLTEEQHRIARLFLAPKLDPDELFAETQWGVLETGSPVLDGALAVFDCRVRHSVCNGTHNIYVGSVAASTSLDEDGLMYRAGVFRRLAPAGLR